MKNFAARTLLLAMVLVTSLSVSCNKTTTESGSGGAQTTAAGGTETSSGQQQMAANPATDFKFKTPGGSTESLSKYLGKPLVVNFWADW